MGLKNLARKDEQKKKEEATPEKDQPMFRHYDVELQFRDRVYGGLPKHAAMISSYVEGKFGKENGDLADKLKEEVDLVEEEEKVSCGFKKNEQGLHLCDYQVKAMLREAATMLQITVKKRGSKQVLQHGLFVKPPALSLGKQDPDGEQEFAGHVMTPKGKRSILKKADYVEKPRIKMTLWVLRDHKLNGDDLKKCFELGQELGMGSCRSFESGKFDLVKFEELDDAGIA